MIMNQTQKDVFIKEAKCPVCGKTFIPAPYHAYRDKRCHKRVCSWSCVCESDHLKNGIKKQSKKGDGQS